MIAKRFVRRGLLVALALGTATSVARSQATPDAAARAAAWNTLKAHLRMIEDYATTQYTNGYQVVNVMRGVPATQGQAERFVAVLTLLHGEHRSTASTLVSSTGNTVRAATEGMRELKGLRGQFLDLATKMARDRTPQSEAAFRQFASRFSSTLRGLSTNHYSLLSRRLTAFANQCEQHDSIAFKYSAPALSAINTFYADPRYANDRRRHLAMHKSVFDFFTRWDAQQPQVRAASRMVANDFGNIDRDTKALAALIDSKEFLDDIPDIEAKSVVNAIDRIDGYLATYR